jgi:hypothetical protein
MGLSGCLAVLRVALRELAGEIGQGHGGEALEKQRLRLGEGVVEHGIDRLLDHAAGRLVAVADGEDRGLPQDVVETAQRHRLEVAGDRPAAGRSPGRAHEARLAQEAHGPAHDDGIGAHALRQRLRRQRLVPLRHVEEGVEHGGEAAVAFHVTSIITIRGGTQPAARTGADPDAFEPKQRLAGR